MLIRPNYLDPVTQSVWPGITVGGWRLVTTPVIFSFWRRHRKSCWSIGFENKNQTVTMTQDFIPDGSCTGDFVCFLRNEMLKDNWSWSTYICCSSRCTLTQKHTDPVAPSTPLRYGLKSLESASPMSSVSSSLSVWRNQTLHFLGNQTFSHWGAQLCKKTTYGPLSLFDAKHVGWSSVNPDQTEIWPTITLVSINGNWTGDGHSAFPNLLQDVEVFFTPTFLYPTEWGKLGCPCL